MLNSVKLWVDMSATIRIPKHAHLELHFYPQDFYNDNNDIQILSICILEKKKKKTRDAMCHFVPDTIKPKFPFYDLHKQLFWPGQSIHVSVINITCNC